MAVRRDLSRITKVIVDAGNGTFPQAESMLLAEGLNVWVDPSRAHEPAAQAAALTAVLTGARCFPGGVTLQGAVDAPLVLSLPITSCTLGEAATALGASETPIARARWVLVGGAPPSEGFAVRAWWDGWTAGTEPVDAERKPGDGGVALAGAAAGALSVGAAFRSLCGEACAAREPHHVSLWTPGEDDRSGPPGVRLPDALWLVGLGNLGQAYLWALSLLPYAEPTALHLLLQDEDVVKEENWGTSVLVRHSQYGSLKTRVAEDWAVRRGFQVRRIDCWLDGATTARNTDPPVVLSGLDSVRARRLLAPLAVDRIIDCGLGGSASDYVSYRLSIFDPTHRIEEHLRGMRDVTRAPGNLKLDAYRNETLSRCGAAELAGASVAVPFVSAFAATLAVAQAVRIANGHAHVRSVVGGLDGLTRPRVVQGLVEPCRRVGSTPSL